MTPAEFLAAFQSGEFKLVPGKPPILSVPRTRHELCAELRKGASLSGYGLLHALLMLSGPIGLSYDQSKTVVMGLAEFNKKGSTDIDLSPISGTGIAVVKCRFPTPCGGACVFTADGGSSWVGIWKGKMLTLPAKGWVAQAYSHLVDKIAENYSPKYFDHDIREWAIYEYVGGKIQIREGKIYQTSQHPLRDLSLLVSRAAENLKTGNFIFEKGTPQHLIPPHREIISGLNGLRSDIQEMVRELKRKREESEDKSKPPKKRQRREE